MQNVNCKVQTGRSIAFFILHFSFCILHSSLLPLVLLFALARPALAQVELPEFDRAAPIIVTAQAANQWQQGTYEVWLLSGDCLIQQGQGYAQPRDRLVD